MNIFVEAATEATTEESNYQSVNDFWLFVVYCLVVVVVVIFFSFYFNRVLGQLVTFLINQYTWRKYNAYIEVDSIRVSLLGGRLLFKNLRYFSTNQSISILKGHIAVRYWLLHVRKSDDNSSNLPCRIACSVEGLEWFFYNNSIAYNTVRDILGVRSKGAKEEPENDNPLFQKILPIQFECATGSIMIGNTSIKSMLVCKTEQASGIYSVTQSRSPLDRYKSVLDLDLKNLQFNLKENMDYDTMKETVKPFREITLLDLVLKPLRKIYLFKSRQYGEMKHLHDLMGDERNQGAHEATSNTYHKEYARVVNVFECSHLSLMYYADYAGLVPSLDESNVYSGIGIDIGNGGPPPEWGVRMSIWDAMFHYGPWTDKQRCEIQDYFFPNSHRHHVPTKKLVPGQQRIATSFDTYIEFMNGCCLRVPTREKSKDWKYTVGIVDLDIGSDGYYTRPYGWLNIKANEGSFIRLKTPYVCGTYGYTSIADIVLKEADLTTSVNYASFVQLKRIEIRVTMPSPLEWNGARQWDFRINVKKPVLFLLRDHIYLVQDFLNDWNSFPPMNILSFTPMIYQLKLTLDDPIIYLCVNEHNIIRHPNSIEDNAYLKLQSHYLSLNVTFPFTEYQPETTSIRFFVRATNVSAGLSLQTSHTFSSFMRDEDTNTAVAVNMEIDGTYDYYSTVDILRHIESCNMHVKIEGATVKLFGTLIRYLFILRDNYFGEWSNFLTIDEYRKQRSNPQEWLEQKKKKEAAKPLSDPFEVYVLLELEDGVMLFPENLYECSSYSQFEFQQLQVEVRNLDVYLDMYVNISPITLSRDIAPNPQPKEGFFRIKNNRDPKNYLYIDGLNVYAHRLFGPLPECATYLCHWEFDVGRITGEIKPSFLLGLACFGQTFAYNLIDEDNAVPQEMKSKELPDVSFVKLHIQEVDVSLMSINSATNFSLKEGVLLEFDNLINKKYSQRITIKIPNILTRCLANPDQVNNANVAEEKEYPWVEVAKAELGLNITVFRHTALWEKARNEQQNFVRTQDYPTLRCVRLYEEADTNSRSSVSSTKSVADHHVGILYAPPFRPFMFGRVEDKSVLYDVKLYKPYVSISNRSSYIEYYESESSSNDQAASLNESDYEHFEFDEASSYDDYSFRTDTSVYNESFHTANNSSYSDDDFSSISSEGYSSPVEDSNEPSQVSRENEASMNFKSSPKNILKTAIPPSIPYGGYLRRYKVKRPYSYHEDEEFFDPHLPPAHPQFVPEKPFEDEFQPFSKINEEHFMEETDSIDEEESQGNFEKGNEVLATTVVEATRPVTVLVTPIMIKVIQELTEEVVKDDWDLESMLDALQMNYIEQLTRYLTNQYISTKFAVILPHMYLRCIQNVVIPDGLPSYMDGEAFIKTQYNLEDTVLCSGNIFLNNFKLIGSVKFEDYAYQEKMDKVAESNLKLQELRLHIDLENMGSTVQYVSKQYDRSSFSFGIPPEYLRNRKFYNDLNTGDVLENELIVLDFALSGFGLKLLGARMPNYLELKTDNVDSVIITESVEILIGAVYSWLVFVDDLKGILKSFQDRRTRQIQVFVNEIANFSNTQGVVSDPIFLTVPSTMLRLGSRNFRNDCGWKLLAHMRHCLQLMPLSNREELQYRLTSGNTLQNLKSNEMFNNIVETFSHWRSWEVSYDDVTHCRLFTQPFEKTASKKRQENGDEFTEEVVKLLTTSSNFGKIRIGAFKFTVFEEETTSLYNAENSISVGPFEFLFECLLKKSYLSPSLDESSVPMNGRLKPNNADKYLDIITTVNLGEVIISVNPIIMAFARHMILVQRVFTNKMLNLRNTVNVENSPSPSASSTRLTDGVNNETFDFDTLLCKIDVVAQCLINLDGIQVVVHSQDLQMDSHITTIQGSALFSNPKLSPLQLNTYGDHDSDTVSAKKSSTRGRKNTHTNSRLVLEATCGIKSINMQFSEGLNGNYGSSILLGILLDSINFNANISQIVKAPKKNSMSETTRDVLNVFSNIHSFRIHIPQSLLKLYGFVESWQSQQGSKFNFLFQNLVKEWEEQRKHSLSLSRPTSLLIENSAVDNVVKPKIQAKTMGLKVQFMLKEFFIKADLLPSLSVEYRVLNFFTMVDKIHRREKPSYTYALQLSKQIIHLITQNPKKPKLEDNGSSFNIPGIKSTGSLISDAIGSGLTVTNLRATISVDVISMSLDASLIDSLLTTQSLLGNEISELIEFISYSQKKTSSMDSLKAHPKRTPSNHNLKYTVDIALDGLSISASSPSAVGMFRSKVLEATLSNDTTYVPDHIKSLDQLVWKLKAENFSLSLDHNTKEVIHFSDSSYRRNCLAYILVDFSIQNYLPRCKSEGCAKGTHVHETEDVTESIYIYFSKIHATMQPIALGKLAEISIYYDSELRKKKQLKKDEIDQLSANTKRIVQTISSKNNWPTQEDYSASFFDGKVVNLHIRHVGIAIPLDLDTNKDASALLFSIESIEFLTKNIEKNALQLDNTTLQFVRKFDQSKADHFHAEKHPQANQIKFPLVTCRVSAKTAKPVQTVLADAHVSGFDIDVEGNIAEYINALSSVYAKCKDRVESFTKPRSHPSTPSTTSGFEIDELRFECKLMCESSNIRFYPKKHKKRQKSTRSVQAEIVGQGNIMIPGLSAWVTYQTPLGTHQLHAQKRFHGDVLILESTNTIHPSAVEFLSEVASDLKIGIQESSERKAQNRPTIESNMDFSLFLRLSKSQLELTCQPVSKVVCSLGWEESEFLISSYNISSRSMSCLGSLREMTATIKHHFSPEPCLHARIDQVILNVMFTSQDDTLSVVLNIPNIIGELNMRHLQDLLILESCWFLQHKLPEIKSTSNSPRLPLESRSASTLSLPASTQHRAVSPSSPVLFSKQVAVVINNMKFSVDLSHHIGTITFIPTSLSLQFHHIPFESKGVDLTLDEASILSKGRLFGDANLKRTVVGCRMDQSHHRETSFICVRSDGFTATFQYEYQSIIDFLQHPLEFNVDYRRVSGIYEIQVSIQLEALFARLSVKSVPVIITIAQKFKELLRKKKAEVGLLVVQEKPITFKHNSAYERSSVQSQILLRIKAMDIVIYPNQFEDADNVSIRSKGFKVHLEEFPRQLSGIHRKLKVKIVSAALAKNVPGKDLMALYQGALPIVKPKNMSGTKIFGVPETSLLMESTELNRHISYTFDALFAGRISVSLNIGLIKYLQEMATMFNLQVDRALGKSSPLNGSEEFDKTPTTLVTESQEADTSNFVYTPISAVNFQPQLQVMGDATPPVEWLGLNREKIPGQIHENLTLHLDKLIGVIWDVLEKQADKQ